MMRRALFAVVVALSVSQTAQTPQQLVDQIQGLLSQLKVQLTSSVPKPVHVTDGTTLLAALKTGGAIELAAGTYTGNFTVSAPTTLSGPCSSAVSTLSPADKLAPTFVVAANDVVVKCLTITNGAPDRETVVVGSNTATSADAQPHRVTFDTVIVLAGPTGGHRGFSLHGVDITVKNSRVVGFFEKGRDAQGIWINNGPGPYTISSNYIEGSGENFLVGGDNVAIPGLVPSDITVRGNTFFAPEAWRTTATRKNAFELKNARHVTVEDNTMDGNWKNGQDGATILLTARNQYGTCPWCGVDDVTLRRNVVKRAVDGPCVSILGTDNNFPSAQTQTVTIDRNLCVDAPSGIRVAAGVLTKLAITNNTFPAIKGSFLQFTGAGVTPLVFSKNVAPSGAYGITGDATIGQAALDKHTLVLDFSGNILEKSAARTIAYPAGNTLLAPGGLKALLDATFKLGDGTVGY